MADIISLPPDYSPIVRERYATLEAHSITTRALEEYFSGCFDDVIRQWKLYPMWVCMSCIASGTFTKDWGKRRALCPTCGSSALYEVATFNARASKVGDVFECAFYYLLRKQGIGLARADRETHDFEGARGEGIETKGSPDSCPLPNGDRVTLDRPGMERSDTRKKALNNAREFKSRHPDNRFYIVTNALPRDLARRQLSDVDAIFNVTQYREYDDLLERLRS